MIQSRTLQVAVTAIAVWVSYYFLLADTNLIYSTPDAQSYINYASYRLPVYGWLANATGAGLPYLQGAAYVLSCVLLAAATRKTWPGVVLALNLSLVAITFHALTESFAVLAVCGGLYAWQQKRWWALAGCVAALVILRPIVPLPVDAFREMAQINVDRFAAQVAQCEKYYGHIGAIIWVWRTNVLNGLFGLSNFTPGSLRIVAMVYNSVLWLALLVNINGARWYFVALLGYLILICGVTSGQGDRVMLIAVPVVIYTIMKQR